MEALYDHSARNPDELSFKKNDVLIIAKPAGDLQWYRALLRIYWALLQIYWTVMRICWTLLRIYWALLRIYWALLRIYWALLRIYWTLMRMYRPRTPAGDLQWYCIGGCFADL